MQPFRCNRRKSGCTILIVICLVHQIHSLAAGPQSLALKALAPQGIVVPKRSALISGLNNQFKVKSTNKTQPLVNGAQPATVSSSSQQQQDSTQSKPQGLFSTNFHWLGSRIVNQQNGQNKGKFQQQQQHVQQQSLYLDRHQQEILAANPNLLNPPANSLFTRSDTGSLNNFNENNPQTISNSSGNDKQQYLNNNDQLYRGYSLIELEVRSESDRRYIQDLYGNLTQAINDQAKNPNALTVSPYVDVDFWSFRYAINDHLDIMVSPKSRTFLLNQLNKAKIKHRVKIDDIQSKLSDSQQAALASGQATSVSSQFNFEQQAPFSQAKSAEGPGILSGRQSSNSADRHSANANNNINLNARQGEQQQQAAQRQINDTIFFENYQRLTEINSYLEQIMERNRDVAQVKVIGRSSQGRYLRVLKLGYDQTDSDGGTSPDFGRESFERHAPAPQPPSMSSSSNLIDKPPMGLNNASHILNAFFKKQESATKLGSIWLDGGTHAREWISPATTMFIAHRLADNHEKCRRFFETLKTVVSQAESLYERRQARGFESASHNSALDASILLGLNEINTSLLGGKPAKQARPRTELEHTLELLAKQPQEVASEYSCNLDIEQLLRRYTFFIMPVLNPDGYEYSHTHNRLWRKTRSTSQHPIYRHFCLGADPNRNYDARHGSTGSSTHPCSQTFAGNVPFTEPETRHQSNFVYSNRIGMKMFISFHSYSQMILLPYSHSVQLAPDHKDLDSVGQAAVKAIERTHGTVYRVGPSASILYTASGTASDWAYEKAGIKYSYTIELRDTGAFGFLLPRQQIVPTGEETFNGLLAMIEQMEKNDRLLTSKSGSGSQGSQTDGSLSSNSTDFLQHVPSDLEEHLFSQNKNRIRSRPTLENVLKQQPGGDQVNSLLLGGARDRKPASEIAANQDNLNDATMKPADELLSPYEPEPVSYEAAAHRFGEEIISNDSEPDSGYAFEGEGELMEPTRENILEAAKMSEASRLSGRQDHSRRIVQSAGVTAGGRNLINSPLLTIRTSSLSGGGGGERQPARRESSDDMIDRETSALTSSLLVAKMANP